MRGLVTRRSELTSRASRSRASTVADDVRAEHLGATRGPSGACGGARRPCRPRRSGRAGGIDDAVSSGGWLGRHVRHRATVSPRAPVRGRVRDTGAAAPPWSSSGQQTRCIQPKASSARPYWMSTRSWRISIVSGPASSLSGPSPADLAAVPLQRPNRRDDRGRAAGEDLGDLAAGHALAPLVDRELPLLDRDPSSAPGR